MTISRARFSGKKVGLLAMLLQVFAFEKLHGDVGDFLVFARVEDADDVRMRQVAGGFGFAEEAFLHAT